MDKIVYARTLAETGDEEIGQTPAIWNKFPIYDIQQDPGRGCLFTDDFVNFAGFAATGVSGNYSAYIDTGDTIRNLNNVAGGAISITTAATLYNGPVLGLGTATSGGTTAPFVLDSAPNGRLLAFEARLRVPSASLSQQNAFVGLATAARCIDNGLCLDAAADLALSSYVADIDQIGFFMASVSSGDPKWYAHYKKSGSAVSAGDVTVDVTPNTWYRLGLLFDPDTGLLSWFVNGMVVRSLNVATAGTGFPTSSYMTAYFMTKTTASAIKRIDLDWLRIGQVK